MELTDFTNSFGLSGLDFSLLLNKIYYVVGIGFLLAVLGGVVFIFIFLKRRNKTKIGGIKIGWWQEVGERLEPTNMETVEEIVIPGTILRIFYGKKRNIWLPKFSRGVSKNLYYVALTKSGQMVNFELGNLSKNLKDAQLIFDHTDMLWAAENAREFIKKNYTDKSTVWWQLYKDTLATAALIFVMTFCFIIIIFFMRGIVQDLGGVASQITSALERMPTQSGLVPAG